MKIKKPSLWHQSLGDVWGQYGPPTRPSKEEIRIEKNWILKHSGKNPRLKTLVLGATPEYRDLLRELGHKVILVDISMSNIQAMSEYMKRKNPDEIWMASDWLKAPLPEKYFDVVMGDMVMPNVPLKSQNELLKKIASVLKPGGIFIHRHYTVKNKVSPQEVARLYLNKNRHHFHWRMLSTGYDEKTMTVISAKACEQVKNFSRSLPKKADKKLKQLCVEYPNFYPAGKTWWATPESLHQKMLEKHFKILSRVPGAGHLFGEDTPLYLMKVLR